jgi:hypothetical protein
MMQSSADPTPFWEHPPLPPMPSAADVEHARRLGNAELFDRPPPPDRDKVTQNLAELPILAELAQISRWSGSMHELPVSSDRLAAILAVQDRAEILVEIASDPSSRLRSHAAAAAAYLRVDAAMPAMQAMLDAPISPWPRPQAFRADEHVAEAKASLVHYAEAVAAWRTAAVALASFDRPEFFPRLTALLFEPPAWFVAPNQPDRQHDRDEIRAARQVVYRMLVRAGRSSDWEALKRYEAQVWSGSTIASDALPDLTQIALAVRRDFTIIQGHAWADDEVDQVAVRGERARARLRGQGLRFSLRRQDGIWRVDDVWPCSSS